MPGNSSGSKNISSIKNIHLLVLAGGVSYEREDCTGCSGYVFLLILVNSIIAFKVMEKILFLLCDYIFLVLYNRGVIRSGCFRQMRPSMVKTEGLTNSRKRNLWLVT